MYLIAIGWLYVALMMAVAEATNSTGSVLGALFTFLLYGVGPVSLLMYILGTPGRRRAIKAKAREADEQAQGDSQTPDAGRQPTTDAVPPVREKL
jgi:hypothetical protein